MTPVSIETEYFSRYRILSELPCGGIARVHVAQREPGGEICVLKRLRIDLRDHESAARRLHREAHVAAHLRHKNIARLIDAGLEDDTFYLASELVPGVELARVIDLIEKDGRRLPPEVAVRIALEVLAGLEHAHEAVGSDGVPFNVVHRDLSPRNVIVGFDGCVKIIDFGAARCDVDNFQTLPGIIVGTPRYIAPELIAGHKADRRSDLYAVAALLYEMLAGRALAPFAPTIEILRWHVSQPPPPLVEIEPEVPDEISDVVAKGLAKDPEDRWQSASQMLWALAQALGPSELSSSASIGALIRHLFPEEVAATKALIDRATTRSALVRDARIATVDSVAPFVTLRQIA
jgi:serine/threonine protein kinase